MDPMNPMRLAYLKPILLACAFLGVGQWSGVGFAQTADALYRRGLAATCANCHGTDGKGVMGAGIPLINQLSNEEMLAQLIAFKSGTREGTIMPQLSKGYSNEQLTTIANQLGKKQ